MDCIHVEAGRLSNFTEYYMTLLLRASVSELCLFTSTF